MAKPTTSGFTISGLLDRSASIRNDYPVERIPIEEIADHPANAAYSMDDAGIAQLARSIKEEGLTDLPLVRKLGDGSWQMVSGHRRKAAYALLAKEDERYSQIPCRVIRDITDEQSVMLLHAANYFVRSLTVSERAAASRALGVEVERMRAENPELAGVRTEDIKAAIISEQTGRKVSGKTIQRQESLARKIEERLVPEWREAALSDALSADAKSRRAPMKSSSPHRGRMRRCGASTRRRSNGGSNPHRLTAKAKFPKRQPFMRLGMALLRSTAPRRRSASRRPAKPLGFRGRSISPSRVILASSAPPLHAP